MSKKSDFEEMVEVVEEETVEEETVEEEVAEDVYVMVNMGEVFDLVPANSAFYAYPGGLTTPTCDEEVNWMVNKNVLRVNPT